MLDLGAGAGYHARVLASRGFSVTAVDTSETLLKELELHDSGTLEITPAIHERFERGDSEIVAAIRKLHELRNPEITAAIRGLQSLPVLLRLYPKVVLKLVADYGRRDLAESMTNLFALLRPARGKRFFRRRIARVLNAAYKLEAGKPKDKPFTESGLKRWETQAEKTATKPGPPRVRVFKPRSSYRRRSPTTGRE